MSEPVNCLPTSVHRFPRLRSRVSRSSSENSQLRLSNCVWLIAQLFFMAAAPSTAPFSLRKVRRCMTYLTLSRGEPTHYSQYELSCGMDLGATNVIRIRSQPY